MSKLTIKEQKVLTFIREYIAQKNEAPTLEEIRKELGFNWINSVQRLVSSLEKKEAIGKDSNKSRGIWLKKNKTETVNVPIVGTAPCGSPLLAIQNIEGYIPTDKSLLNGNSKDYFYLRALGDSMDKAGISEGDLVLFHSQKIANEGQVVVALVNDNATIKIFKRGKDCIVLEPRSTNDKHKPIILRKNFSIQGIMVRLIPV